MKPADNSVVRFRCPSVSDADLLYAGAFGDAAVTRHLQWDTHANPDETKALIEEMIGLHQRGEKYFWVALCTEDDRIVGLGSIKPGADTAWIGFLVLSGAQRKGFGSVIVSALEDVVFGRFESVSAAVAPGNQASIELLRSSGWVEWPNPEVTPLLAFHKYRENHGGAANGSQPSGSQTHATSPAAGSSR